MNKKLFEYSYTLKKEKQHKDIMIFVYIALAVFFISVIFSLVIFPVRQVSSSMTPSVKKQSMVMVTPLVKNPSRGDIVLLKPQADVKLGFWKSLGGSVTTFFTAEQIHLSEDKNFPGTVPEIRRVVGIPGDTIYLSKNEAKIKPAGNRHFVSEHELCDGAYDLEIEALPEDWDVSIGFSGDTEQITLGEGEYFVLSDKRSSNNDSRLWGPVNQSQIKGKVLLCYFPFKNLALY